MRNVSFTVVFCLLSVVALSQGGVVAEISNIRNDKGICRACLFNNPSSFTGQTGQPFRCVAVRVKGQTARAVFTNVPAGTYAMLVFHDANSNLKMDKNFLGIPKEGYGASKNKLRFASAPSYEENKFGVDGRTTVQLQIRMRNL
jgi:uncharacterized protein (DUF2141 family)